MAATASTLFGWVGRVLHTATQKPATPEEVDAMFGFSRPEMFSHNVAETVKTYKTHIFVSSGTQPASEWAPKAVEAHSLASALAASAHKVILSCSEKLHVDRKGHSCHVV